MTSKSLKVCSVLQSLENLLVLKIRKNALRLWAKVTQKHFDKSLKCFAETQNERAVINIIIPTLNYTIYNNIHSPVIKRQHNVNNMFSKCPRLHIRYTNKKQKSFLKPRLSSYEEFYPKRLSVEKKKVIFKNMQRSNLRLMISITARDREAEIRLWNETLHICMDSLRSADVCEGHQSALWNEQMWGAKRRSLRHLNTIKPERLPPTTEQKRPSDLPEPP